MRFILRLIIKTKNIFLWKIQTVRLKKDIKKPKLKKINLYGNMLIIVPHADDELIGCYYFIKKYIKDIDIFYCGYTGSNFSYENKNIREQEFKNLANKLGVRYIISSRNQGKELKKLIAKNNYSFILAPSLIDWHKEHRKINYILKEIILKEESNFRIIWYQISVPLNIDCVNFNIGANKKLFEEKWENFEKIYKSQKTMPILRYQLYEKLIGKLVGRYSCENYISLPQNYFLEYINLLNFKEKEEQLNLLKNKINNLEEIYLEAAKFYKKN